MDYKNIFNAFKNLGIIMWEIIKWQPGIVVPFLLVIIIGKIAHLPKNERNFLENFFSLFF